MAIRLSRDYLLVVRRTELDAPSFRVDIAQRFADVIREWGPTTRASPIFATDGSTLPEFGARKVTKVCFVGPISPTLAPLGLPLFLSYGLYNCVLFSTEKKQHAILDKFIGSLTSVAWELWTLKGNRIVNAEYSPLLGRAQPLHELHPFPQVAEELRSASEEYQTLLAMTRARTTPYLPEVANELETLATALAEKLKLSLHDISKLQWLININAALSRFSSQTFAGTSPILGTECHYWTHSLLGIGLATKALLNIRRYIDKAAVAADLESRIGLYKSRPPEPERLASKSASDKWWINNRLPNLPSSAEKLSQARLPLIVFFSGRDGFKNTPFTLSVPLEILQSANTMAWSLQTLTHEVSHVFIESVFAALLEGSFEDAAWRERMLRILDKKEHPRNLHEQLQELFMWSLAMLERERQGLEDNKRLNLQPDDMAALVIDYHHEVSELLTHTFDFLHFYRRDPKKYINSIWSSWDTIPNIRDRITGYLIRSLCALCLTNLSLKDCVNITISELQGYLREVKATHSGDQYIGIALKKLETDVNDYREKLHFRLPLLKLASVVLDSPSISKLLTQEWPEAGHVYKSLRPKQFPINRQVDNPLRFVHEFSNDLSRDPLKSMWLITQLAFSDVHGNK